MLLHILGANYQLHYRGFYLLNLKTYKNLNNKLKINKKTQIMSFICNTMPRKTCLKHKAKISKLWRKMRVSKMDKLGVGKIKDTKEVEIVEEDEEDIKIINIIIIIIVNIKTAGIKIILRLITRAKEVRSRM